MFEVLVIICNFDPMKIKFQWVHMVTVRCTILIKHEQTESETLFR